MVSGNRFGWCRDVCLWAAASEPSIRRIRPHQFCPFPPCNLTSGVRPHRLAGAVGTLARQGAQDGAEANVASIVSTARVSTFGGMTDGVTSGHLVSCWAFFGDRLGARTNPAPIR